MIVMSSKHLDSILKKIPSATVVGENKILDNLSHETQLLNQEFAKHNQDEETDRIVAVIPKTLKQEIQEYVKSHKGDTEKIVILKALKLMGFKVLDKWLIDKRSTR
jgi:hypothetical protein